MAAQNLNNLHQVVAPIAVYLEKADYELEKVEQELRRKTKKSGANAMRTLEKIQALRRAVQEIQRDSQNVAASQKDLLETVLRLSRENQEMVEKLAARGGIDCEANKSMEEDTQAAIQTTLGRLDQLCG